jgi:hypothetical protein
MKLPIQMDKYPEYYSLTEYQRKCLVATNYFRVLNGEYEIPVPPSDEHYFKYFNNNCYEKATLYKEMKKRELEFKNNFAKLTFSNRKTNECESQSGRQNQYDFIEKQASKDNQNDKDGRIGSSGKKIRLSKEEKEKKVNSSNTKISLFDE